MSGSYLYIHTEARTGHWSASSVTLFPFGERRGLPQNLKLAMYAGVAGGSSPDLRGLHPLMLAFRHAQSCWLFVFLLGIQTSFPHLRCSLPLSPLPNTVSSSVMYWLAIGMCSEKRDCKLTAKLTPTLVV